MPAKSTVGRRTNELKPGLDRLELPTELVSFFVIGKITATDSKVKVDQTYHRMTSPTTFTSD
jgi:hypothetical protein